MHPTRRAHARHFPESAREKIYFPAHRARGEGGRQRQPVGSVSALRLSLPGFVPAIFRRTIAVRAAYLDNLVCDLHGLDVPDITTVVADCAIRGELTNPRHVE